MIANYIRIHIKIPYIQIHSSVPLNLIVGESCGLFLPEPQLSPNAVWSPLGGPPPPPLTPPLLRLRCRRPWCQLGDLVFAPAAAGEGGGGDPAGEQYYQGEARRRQWRHPREPLGHWDQRDRWDPQRHAQNPQLVEEGGGEFRS